MSHHFPTAVAQNVVSIPITRCFVRRRTCAKETMGLEEKGAERKLCELNEWKDATGRWRCLTRSTYKAEDSTFIYIVSLENEARLTRLYTALKCIIDTNSQPLVHFLYSSARFLIFLLISLSLFFSSLFLSFLLLILCCIRPFSCCFSCYTCWCDVTSPLTSLHVASPPLVNPLQNNNSRSFILPDNALLRHCYIV